MPPEKKKLRKILDNFPAVEDLIAKRKNLNIFLNFDGTLAPIAETPDQAVAPSETIGVLKKIQEYPNVFVAVLSGRSLEDLRKTLKVDGLRYVGNHGLEISGVKRTEIVPNAAHVVRSIKKITDDLNKVLITVPGAWVENKGLTASVHYRAVPLTHVGELNRLVGEISMRYIDRKIVRLTRGKKVIEIRPNIDWNKGHAVKWLLKNIAKKRATSVYVGDDVTDEDVFKVLETGITVKVSDDARTKTHAHYFVNNPTEVRFFLQWLLEKVGTK
jgi:trehalose-phosphatase